MRDQISNKVLEWREEAEINQSNLSIDVAHMLDIECFSLLNWALAGDVIHVRRGTIYRSPSKDKETNDIPRTRYEEKDCQMGVDALTILAKIATQWNLPYS